MSRLSSDLVAGITDLSTPGVYIREVEVVPPRPLRLGVTGFVGQAERGPLNDPQPLSTWGQFVDVFGGFVGFSYLPYAVFGFFLNGGERCYVVRVAHENARTARSQLDDERGFPAILVEAANEGEWGDSLQVDVGRSTAEIVLTQLTEDAAAGATTVRLASVAGMAETVPFSPPGIEEISIVHPLDARVREDRLGVLHIDFTRSIVTLDRPLAFAFPPGSGVVGKGFRFTARYVPADRAPREEVFDSLSMEPTHPRYFAAIINGRPGIDYVQRARNGNSILVRVADLTQSLSAPPARLAATAATPLIGGDDGPLQLDARYYAGRDHDLYFRPAASGATTAELRLVEDKKFGLAALEGVEEVGAIALPDLIVPDIYATPGVVIPPDGIVFAKPVLDNIEPRNLAAGQMEMLLHCERAGERFAILDAPPSRSTIEEWPRQFRLHPAARDAALYYPWIRETPRDFNGRDLFIPPSGHIAGIYARAEKERGVAKAPANETLRGIVELEFALNDSEQAVLNPLGVNCLRSFPNRGLLVWGARTLSLDPIWRYVSVRRVYLLIAKGILANLRTTVFEPNDGRLRANITNTLTLFLRGLLQDGALAGARPQDAFFVKCDEQNNPPEVVDAGQCVVEIGFAPVHPAEFVLVTIKRSAASLSVIEELA